ncbi:MAG: HD domain-containing protein [Spirochaetales bacterium]|nr:HD domain-containing protein [Spirochaetales bacterium]
MNDKNAILAYLSKDFTDPVRDPVWGHIYLTPFMRTLIQTEDFGDLGRIRQLGPAIHVYPGATHTRYNHSLGVCHIARKLILHMVQHRECPSLTLRGVKAFLYAALLHDLGHFPYTHSLKELPLIDHEELSGRIIREGEIGRLIGEGPERSARMTAAIVDHSMELGPDEGETVFYRRLLSGVLDPDKLDYLNRDAFFCGVPYGMQDTEFVLSQIIPTPEGISLSEKGTLAVENILFSKYLMYKAVYWHRDVRIATALAKKALYLALKQGDLKGEDLYGLTDEGFRRMVKGLPPSLVGLMKRSENPLASKAALERDFDGANALHRSLENLDDRALFEREIAERLGREGVKISAEEVVIDVPEKISFEVDLPILKEGELRPFTSMETLFSAAAGENLTGVLRKVRLILPPTIDLELEKIVQIAQI